MIIEKLVLCESTPEKLRNKALEKTVTLANIMEFQKTKEIRATINAAFEPKTCLNQINYSKSTPNSTKFRKPRDFQNKSSSQKARSCDNCGEMWTSDHLEKCSNKSIQCFHCSNKGHTKQFCRKRLRGEPATFRSQSAQSQQHKPVNTRKAFSINNSNSSSSNELHHLAPLYRIFQAKHHQPHINCLINGNEIKMLADTGAQVNILCWSTYSKLKNKPVLVESTAKLAAYNSSTFLTTK